MIYDHKVQYYETDQMGIVHHSNHVRWLEEFRSALLENIGFPYAALEARGIIIPVISVETRYHLPARFGDTVSLHGKLDSLTGVRFSLSYEGYNQRREHLFSASSRHCVINRDFRPLRLKKEAPDLYEAFQKMIAENNRMG